jgi:FMN phosphatase YigB (HAD superfamily)
VIKAILCDLDETLLINDMEQFAPPYYQALIHKIEPICTKGAFIEALNKATRAMMRNDGKNGTNAEVFAAEFFPRLDCEPAEIMAMLTEFYRTDFELLREHTAVDPHARELMDLLFERGYQVAITTQPLFPIEAIEARLRWAGVPADRYTYDLITSYEKMRACKPHPAFFRDVLQALGRQPHECLIAGDSIHADMPARDLGIKAFWIDRDREPRPRRVPSDDQGTLADLITLVKTGEIDEL